MRHLFQIVGSFLTVTFHKVYIISFKEWWDLQWSVYYTITAESRVNFFLENWSTLAEVMGN